MSKTKVVLSIVLIVGITIGKSFADTLLLGTDLIDKKHTQSIFLKSMIANDVSTFPHKHNYYNIICYISNLLYPAEMNLSIQRFPNSLNKGNDIFLNSKRINMGNNEAVVGVLKVGNNLLELKNLRFFNTTQSELKFSTSTTNYPGMGYTINYCTYTYSSEKISAQP